MDLSVIVPFYNTPIELIVRCLESIDKLSGDIQYEVICVDDGSTTDDGLRCKEYCAAKPNYTYLRQDHSGVSCARNLGIKQAKGKYLCFVDSDDEMLTEAYTRQLIDNDDQLVIFDIRLIENGRARVWYAFSDAGVKHPSKEEVFLEMIHSTSMNGPVAKLFKRSVILEQGLGFDEQMVNGEDLYFVLNYLLSVDQITYERTPVYVYYRDQATNVKRSVNQIETVLKDLVKITDKKKQMIETICTADREHLLNRLNEDVQLTLFAKASDIVVEKKLTRKLVKEIESISSNYCVSSGYSTAKSMLLCYIMEYHCWILIWVLAYARKLYLKIKFNC